MGVIYYTNIKRVGYLAPCGLINELIAEINQIEAVYGNLVISSAAPQHSLWAQNIWYNPSYIPISSISSAAQILKKQLLRWAPYSYQLHRRTQLIQAQLPSYQVKPIEFLASLPHKPIGSWTLINKNLLLASSHCSSCFPNGEVMFSENKKDPPSRAYLKLWELFTLHGIHPQPSDVCLDLGSSPGGWTWVLQQMGCQVISVDKAKLDPALLNLSNINYLQRSAFSLLPAEMGRIDWLFSDVICYPSRLFKLIQNWLKSNLCKNFVCTIKLQGETDFNAIQQFSAIEGSKLVHLYHNKHELTWFKIS